MNGWHYPMMRILAIEWPIGCFVYRICCVLKNDLHENLFLDVSKSKPLVWFKMYGNDNIGKANHRSDIDRLAWLIICKSCIGYVPKNLGCDIKSTN